jgi:protein-tyrosine-phosphatase
VVAEALGTAFLLTVVIGSGIMGERLAGGNVAIALLANALATGAGLVALILTFGSISGAHFNPAVSIADASQGGLPWREVPAYVVAQVAAAFVGVALAHFMFGLPAFSAFCFNPRSGGLSAGRERVRRDIRPAGDNLGLRPTKAVGCAVRRRRLHHCRVLVYVFNFLREPCCDARARRKRYVCRHTTGRRAWVRCGTAYRRGCRNRLVSLARSIIAGGGSRCGLHQVQWRQRGGSQGGFLMTDQSIHTPIRVLFVCVHNSARSQMAEALLQHIAGERFTVESAGFDPRPVLPEAVQAMKLLGIDLSHAEAKVVFDLYRAGRIFDYVISVCDEATAERCPIFPGVCKRLHWTFADPSAVDGTPAQRLEFALGVRDRIKSRIEDWVAGLERQGVAPLPGGGSREPS